MAPFSRYHCFLAFFPWKTGDRLLIVAQLSYKSCQKWAAPVGCLALSFSSSSFHTSSMGFKSTDCTRQDINYGVEESLGCVFGNDKFGNCLFLSPFTCYLFCLLKLQRNLGRKGKEWDSFILNFYFRGLRLFCGGGNVFLNQLK